MLQYFCGAILQMSCTPFWSYSPTSGISYGVAPVLLRCNATGEFLAVLVSAGQQLEARDGGVRVNGGVAVENLIVAQFPHQLNAEVGRSANLKNRRRREHLDE